MIHRPACPEHSTVCASSTCRGASPARSACCCSPSRAPTSIKVEPPGGDPFRGYEGYAVWNRSRRSVTVDLKTDAGLEALPPARRRRRRARRDVPPGRRRTGSASASTRCTPANPRLVYLLVPRVPRGPPPAAPARATTRSCRRAAGSSGSSRAGGWDRSSCTMPMPSMRRCSLVPTRHPRRAHRARGDRRGQHVRTSLFQGALLYTTQIWQTSSTATRRVLRHDGARRYPPGVHQQMIFEVADDEWVHRR